MKNPSIKFIFDRRKSAEKKGVGAVDVEIYFQRRRKWINTGVFVPPQNWDSQRWVVGLEGSVVMNRKLDTLRGKVNDAIAAIALRGEEFSMQAFEEEYGHKEYKGNFLEYVQAKIEGRRDIEESTRRTHRKLVGALRKFGRIRLFSDVTAYAARRFDEWLHERYDCQTTVFSYHKFLKIYVNMAIREGLLERDPYIGMKLDRGKAAARRFLTEDQLRRIMELDVDDGAVMRARDVFLFQCFTGLAYADLLKFDFSRLEERDGKYVLRGRRQKTGEMYYIVLLSPAVAILKRYGGRLPLVSNQKYNQALKLVAAYSRLSMNLTSHCGRHTYATWCLNKGVKLATLKKMLGHSDIRTTLIYAKMMDRTVEEAFNDLEKQFVV